MHKGATQNSKIINTRIRSIGVFKALKQNKCKLKNYEKCNDFTRLLEMNITGGSGAINTCNSCRQPSVLN